jgi:hypothetical protein
VITPGVCISIGIVIRGSSLEKSTRVMTMRVIGIGYSLVSNRCSSASWPTLPGVELSPYFTKLRVIRRVVPPCLSLSFSHIVYMVNLQSPCVW